MTTTEQREVLRHMRNGNVTEEEVRDCIAAMDVATQPTPGDAAWFDAVRAEADRIEAELGGRLALVSVHDAADVLADEAPTAAFAGMSDARRAERAIHAAAWALILDRRARAVKP
jgi:hypothetical protein